MIEIVFSDSACGSLKLLKTMAKESIVEKQFQYF